MGTVVLIGTMDTKGTEYRFVRDCILSTETKVITIDVGVLEDSAKDVDISSKMTAEAAGEKLENMRCSQEGGNARAKALKIMQEGAFVWLEKLIASGNCDAVLGMGGSGGTSMLADIFHRLPIGFPKILVSTIGTGDVTEIMGATDMTLVYSVTDIAGLNTVSRKILGNAANAAAGMAKYRCRLNEGESKRPLIAITMFGITTKGVLRVRERLEESGFDTIVFHCTGAGGYAMEKMIREGIIDGVIDYTVAELNGHFITGMNDAGEGRLTAASEMRIPQVVVPGALEVCNFPGIAKLPEKYRNAERKVIEHNPLICAVEASAQEREMLGHEMGKRMSKAMKEITALVLPLKGLDSYETVDGPWFNPAGDRIIFDAIQSELDESFRVEKLAANINDKEFADCVAEIFIELNIKYRESKAC